MKLAFLHCTLLLLCLSSILVGQQCLPEGIHFETQSDIDSFPLKYPGCTVIEGDLCIGDCIEPYVYSDITNLDSLGQLISIKGKLTITANPLLTSLEPLRNLEVFEDDVEISGNDMLISLHGLDQVRLMKGSFTLKFNFGLDDISGFDKLDTIAGTLSLIYMDKIESLDAFSKLKFLGGYSLFGMNGISTMPDMDSLEYLGDFKVEYNSQLTDLPQFPLLNSIHGDFEVDGNFNLPVVKGYENIDHVKGNLIISAAGEELHRGVKSFTLDAFHHLKYVGGRLNVYVELLDTLDAFTLLDSIGGSISIDGGNGLHTFPQNNHFKFIGADIGFSSFIFLEDLKCLSELEKINGALQLLSCPNLISLSDISHFNEFGGGLEFSNMNFTSLSDLANLHTIGGSLRIYDCNSLTNLKGLESLTSIDGHIFIFRNHNLISLEGIQNIDPQSIHATGNSAIYISENPRLEICNVASICEALRELKRSYYITDNSQGCDDISQINCKDFGLSGIVYFDMNQNLIQDTNEVGIPGIPVRFQPEDLISLTNKEGQFFVFADSGEVSTMTIEHSSNWLLTTDSLSYTDTFEEGSPGNEDHFFGLLPAFDWFDLSVDLTSNPIRCNQKVHFFLHWLNASTRAVDGRITVQYDSLVTFASALVPPSMHNLVTRELTWSLDSLGLYSGQDVRITFNMPNETFVGQIMTFTAESFIDSSGTEIQIDQEEYTPVVACAVDPNDKIVMPPGQRDENFTLKDDPLTYTVRFENLGNAEAIDITVVDTLDIALDINSFKVINSSYPVLTIINGHVITFFFKNIWLAQNERGFVTYEIKAISDIEDLTPVENFAGIVFDFNQPIITNTTRNTLVYEICEDVAVVIDTVICHGQNFLGYTESGIYFDTLRIGSICDSFTEIRLEVLPPEIILIDTMICEGESYHGFETTGVYTFDSLNIITGCMVIVELSLEIIPIGMGPCITGIGEVDKESFSIYPNPTQGEINIITSATISSVHLLTVDGLTIPLKEKSSIGNKSVFQLEEGTRDGFYFLAVQCEGRMSFEKLVISR